MCAPVIAILPESLCRTTYKGIPKKEMVVLLMVGERVVLRKVMAANRSCLYLQELTGGGGQPTQSSN